MGRVHSRAAHSALMFILLDSLLYSQNGDFRCFDPTEILLFFRDSTEISGSKRSGGSKSPANLCSVALLKLRHLTHVFKKITIAILNFLLAV